MDEKEFHNIMGRHVLTGTGSPRWMQRGWRAGNSVAVRFGLKVSQPELVDTR